MAVMGKLEEKLIKAEPAIQSEDNLNATLADQSIRQTKREAACRRGLRICGILALAYLAAAFLEWCISKGTSQLLTTGLHNAALYLLFFVALDYLRKSYDV